MTTLKNIRDTYLEKNTQFIITNEERIILESDNILFDCKEGTHISEVHPFFLSLESSTIEDTIEFT